MNDWRKSLILLFVASVLAACGTAEGKDAAEVFKQAEKASESLENVAMDMEISQTINTEGADSQGENVEMSISSSGKMQFDPLILHQTMDIETSMGETMDLPNQEMEQYVTENAMYMTNPMDGEWMKAPQTMQEQLNQSVSLENQSPMSQLDMIKEHVSDFSMEETDNTYTLNVAATGDEMKSLLRTVMEESGNGLLTEEMFESTTINETDITFVLAKDTYYPKEVDLTMDITVEEQGQTVHLTQESHMTYSDHNNIEELEVPEDVADNAQVMEMPGLSGTE